MSLGGPSLSEKRKIKRGQSMSNLKRRVKRIEESPENKETKINVHVIWDDFIIDEATGKRYSVEEYYQLYKDDPNHIFVGWDDTDFEE